MAVKQPICIKTSACNDRVNWDCTSPGNEERLSSDKTNSPLKCRGNRCRPGRRQHSGFWAILSRGFRVEFRKWFGKVRRKCERNLGEFWRKRLKHFGVIFKKTSRQIWVNRQKFRKLCEMLKKFSNIFWRRLREFMLISRAKYEGGYVFLF